MTQIQQKPAAATVRHFNSLKSTNATAREHLIDRAATPFWIVADQQSSGRGRHGREWVSEEGNLFASYAQTITAGDANISGLSLLAGLALYDAVTPAIRIELEEQLQLKWPNDLMLQGAKLGGILIENHLNPETGNNEIVIGFGLNITSSPDLSDRETIELQSISSNISRDQIFHELTNTLEVWLNEWQSGQNFEAVRRTFIERSYPLGTPTSVKVGSERISGQYGGIDKDGALILQDAGGKTQIISCGELIS